jgi:hypothetical protein
MGYKNVCLICRKSFNQGTNIKDIHNSNCPDCGQPMVAINHRFRPPKKSELDKWKTVEYLIKNGFFFQKIYNKIENHANKTLKTELVPYPEKLREAKEFVKKYQDQALHINNYYKKDK